MFIDYNNYQLLELKKYLFDNYDSIKENLTENQSNEAEARYILYKYTSCLNNLYFYNNIRECSDDFSVIEFTKNEYKSSLVEYSGNNDKKFKQIIPSLKKAFELTSEINSFNSDSDSYIKILHNGGLNFILDFMMGQNYGYRLEKGDFTGIQVMPEDLLNTRTSKPVFGYLKKAMQRFDVPVFVRFDIQKRYVDSADNDYELGIRSCYSDKLTVDKMQIYYDHIYGFEYRYYQKLIPNETKIKLKKFFNSDLIIIDENNDYSDCGDIPKCYDINPYNNLSYLDLAVTDDQSVILSGDVCKNEI